jgi:uncharacterized oxidoreductase
LVVEPIFSAVSQNVFDALMKGDADEIGYGPTGGPALREQWADAAATFTRSTGRFPVRTYG